MTTTFYPFTASNGAKSWYHVFDYGTRGYMYFFDGDYWDLEDTSVGDPDGGLVAQLRQVAEARQLTLVVVNTPDQDGTGDGFTWWQNTKRNGTYLREVHARVRSVRPNVDPSVVWLVGYSGGAEFITYELMHRGFPGMTAGGAVIVGGGGADAPVATATGTAPAAARPGINLEWYVGAQDVPGATNPPQWSALAAAREGVDAYAAAGFTVVLHVIAGLDHEHYSIADYVARTVPTVSA